MLGLLRIAYCGPFSSLSQFALTVAHAEQLSSGSSQTDSLTTRTSQIG